MSGDESPKPSHAAYAAGVFFLVAAAVVHTEFFRYRGPLVEREARLMDCQRPATSPWSLHFYPGPATVRLELSGEYNRAIAALCARQARVRVVVQAKGNVGEPTTWLQGLEDLDTGEVVISAEERLEETRTTHRIMTVLAVLFAGLGLAATVSAVREFRRSRARPTPPPAPASPDWTKTWSDPRRTDLGPSWFVYRPDRGPIVAMMLVGVGLLVGGCNYLRDLEGMPGNGLGYWTYHFPLGLVLAGAGLALLWLGWRMLHIRTEVYAEGVLYRLLGGERVLRYRDLKTFSYLERGQFGAPCATLCFFDEHETQIPLLIPKGPAEHRLPPVRDRLARLLAERMEAGLDSGVPWTPGVEIHPEGLRFADGLAAPLSFSEPFSLHFERGTFQLMHQGHVHWKGWMSSPNFYPGLLLVERLRGSPSP